MPLNPIIVATGILGWPSDENVTRRYGCIFLFDKELRTIALTQCHPKFGPGSETHILATVVETRANIFTMPSRPGQIMDVKPARVGEIMDLGLGVLWMEASGGHHFFGLRPEDGRPTDWFDINTLRRLHNQTVMLRIADVNMARIGGRYHY